MACWSATVREHLAAVSALGANRHATRAGLAVHRPTRVARRGEPRWLKGPTMAGKRWLTLWAGFESVAAPVVTAASNRNSSRRCHQHHNCSQGHHQRPPLLTRLTGDRPSVLAEGGSLRSNLAARSVTDSGGMPASLSAM